MNINVIKLYIDKLKKDDIKVFLKSNNIIVDDNELDYLCIVVKNKYEDFLNNDITVLNNIKENINNEAYIKLLELYNKYKSLYLD